MVMMCLAERLLCLLQAILNCLSQCFFKKYCNFYDFDGKEC